MRDHRTAADEMREPSLCGTQEVGETNASKNETPDNRGKQGGVDEWLRSYRYSPKSLHLSRQRWLIAQLVACGLSDKEIAYLAGIATSTVKVHISAILKELGRLRRAQVVRYILESGQFSPSLSQELLVSMRGADCSAYTLGV